MGLPPGPPPEPPAAPPPARGDDPAEPAGRQRAPLEHVDEVVARSFRGRTQPSLDAQAVDLLLRPGQPQAARDAGVRAVGADHQAGREAAPAGGRPGGRGEGPPLRRCSSRSLTRSPRAAISLAVRDPAGPAPTTATSQSSAGMLK